MTNAELARALTDLSDLMALDDGDPHRISHYKGAATAIRRFEHPIAEMISAGIDLTQVEGIGTGLASFLVDLVNDGESKRLNDYKDRVPEALLQVMRLDGVGATRARTLWRAGGVESIEDLGAALKGRQIQTLDGFGPAVVSRIRGGLTAREQAEGRVFLSAADRGARAIEALLDELELPFQLAGDIVRREETVGTIDVVVGAGPVVDLVWESVKKASKKEGWTLDSKRGENPVALTVGRGGGARLFSTEPERLEAVAHHLTGPADYLEALGDRALSIGTTLTPLGLEVGPDVRVTEERDVYEALDLPWIPAELRRDEGTLAAVVQSGVPELVNGADVTGDLHMHTTWSDGAASLERMVRAASERGYQYLAITDHSPSTGPVGGLNAQALAEQLDEIGNVQEIHTGVQILAGIEVDILADGTLDLSDETLGRLDIVVASVHSAFEIGEGPMTKRIIRALENPNVDILGHATGRKIGQRLGYPVNLNAVLDAAKDLDVAIEVNGNPRRLDVSSEWLSQCKERGVKVVVSSDAHSVERLDNVGYAVDQARRAWLEKHDIVNTRTGPQLLEWTRRRRV
ncbi:MAG: PHP domain-containing protein [Longimicrobiales bacterium]